MTREEREDAIDYFKRSYASGNTDDERHHNEVLDMAIKSLGILNELNRFCMQDDMHLVTIARIKEIINGD